MFLYNIILLVLYIVFTLLVPNEINPYPDKSLTTLELAAKYGYNLEKHTVITEDGYILQLFRLSISLQKSTKGPVLCMHGIFFSSDIWVLGGPSRGLAFILADAGYDVWLGNARGSRYSRKHVKLNPDHDSKYWEYSFNEIGFYDLPAKINYITKITGYEKIFYIGYSEGATSYFVMTATRPEMNRKIILAALLAPIVYCYDGGSIIMTFIATYQIEFENLAKFFGIRELFPYSKLSVNVFDLMCRNESPFQELCKFITNIVVGLDEDKLDTRIFPVFVSGFAGSSIQSAFHYTQILKSGIFQKYDYGPSGNIQRYGQNIPPSYNLKNIIAPTALFYGNNDIIEPPKSVDVVAKNIPNVVYKYKVKDHKFAHSDYFLHKNVVTKVYRHVLKLMSKY